MRRKNNWFYFLFYTLMDFLWTCINFLNIKFINKFEHSNKAAKLGEN